MTDPLADIRNGRILISVVVCTYNRADMLPRALESLVQQTLDKGLYEVVVVDNASTDATPEVVRNFKVVYRKCNIVLAQEDRLGLGHARNAGFLKARGNYVAFMDDDAKASKEWLDTALRCFEETQPSPIGVGGVILPFYDSPKPVWFKDEYEIRTWGERPRFLKQGESFSGSNMIFRKEILATYGGFDVSIGVQGPYLSVGEETSLFQKIWQARDDANFYYSPRLVVFHAVSHYKMTISYHLKRAFVTGQVWQSQHGPRSTHWRLWSLVKILISVTLHVALAFLPRRTHLARSDWAVENFTPVAMEIGRLAGCLGLSILVRQRGR